MPTQRCVAVNLKLALIAVLLVGVLTSCADDGLREGSGEIDEGTDDDRSGSSGGSSDAAATEPAGADRLACDNPLFWGLGVTIDDGGNTLATVPTQGTHPTARAAADAALILEQPDLGGWADVTERAGGTTTQVDYVVDQQTVAVITVVQRGEGWDFSEGLLCEAHARIVPTELQAMQRALRAAPGVDPLTAKCITERGIEQFGADAWPTVAAGRGDAEQQAQFGTIVAGCRP